MIISEARNPVAMPEQTLYNPGEATRKKESKNEAVDFDKVLDASNFIKQEEIQKEKKAVGTKGEFHVGETKNDKEFREQLEKISGKKIEKGKSKLDQNDYMTLLVTQLKYQDPGKPMDHYEMASQMAQFNTVEQLVGVNKTLAGLSKAQNEARLDKLSQYIDKNVEVQGNVLKLNPDNSTTISHFELPVNAATVSLEIKDSQGKNVRTMTLGSLQMGSHDVNWDGKTTQGAKCNAGNYTFEVHAASEDGKEISSKKSYFTKVTGVTDLLQGGKLETSTGAIDLTKVISVRNIHQSETKSKSDENLIANKPKTEEKTVAKPRTITHEKEPAKSIQKPITTPQQNPKINQIKQALATSKGAQNVIHK